MSESDNFKMDLMSRVVSARETKKDQGWVTTGKDRGFGGSMREKVERSVNGRHAYLVIDAFGTWTNLHTF